MKSIFFIVAFLSGFIFINAQGTYIIVMDGQFRDIVYDKENRDNGRTNGHEIDDIFKGYDNLDVTVLVTSFDWGEKQFDIILNVLKPALIIMHWSAFYSPQVSNNQKDPLDTFFERLNMLCKDDDPYIPKILLFSRDSQFEVLSSKQKIKQHYVQKAPCINNNMELLRIVRFKDGTERAKLISAVFNILN